MTSDDNKNLILASVLALAIIVGWQLLFPPPPPPAPETVDTPAEATAVPGAGQTVLGATDLAGTPGALQATRDAALARTERIAFGNGAVDGSISLKGGRLDDLHLSRYNVTLDDASPTVTLLSPTGGPLPYYAVYGWLPVQGQESGPLPNANTEWVVESGDRLAPGAPVTLVWENGAGLTFRRELSIDENYMFTVRQSVGNGTDSALSLAPYGYIARRGLPDLTGIYILHEGGVGMVDGELVETDYSDLDDLPPNALEGGKAEARSVTADGWLGFTDKYWMTTLAPKPGQAFDAVYKTIETGGAPEYRAEMRLPVMSVAPGESVSVETWLFAGAKEVKTIQDYEDRLGIAGFEDSVDWGWFFFLTKPIFEALHFFYEIIGNMGWAIIVLTVAIKTLLFPLAYKSFVSMSRMKKLQPEMEKLKERCGDDRQKLQQEMMALYKKEKVNPAAGCLPILMQIPIFFSLYKVLFVTIEMRHAPFIGWIEDLSAPDPTSWMNLFGALPWDAPDPGSMLAIFSIGIYPIVMGVTMWLQQKLNPAPADPTQAMIFAYMPWIFMFMLGTFASGLVIYWCANNILTFTQQYIIMRSQGVEVDLLGNITAGFKKLRKKKQA